MCSDAKFPFEDYSQVVTPCLHQKIVCFEAFRSEKDFESWLWSSWCSVQSQTSVSLLPAMSATSLQLFQHNVHSTFLVIFSLSSTAERRFYPFLFISFKLRQELFTSPCTTIHLRRNILRFHSAQGHIVTTAAPNWNNVINSTQGNSCNASKSCNLCKKLTNATKRQTT